MSLIDKVKAQVSILAEASKDTKVKAGTGGKYSVRCPFHQDDTPSMVINSLKGTFQCYGCGIRGTVLDWVMERDRLGVMEAAEYLADEYGITREQDPLWDARRALVAQNRERATYAKNRLAEVPAPLAYLRSRGITDATVEAYQLGATKNGDAVVIPFGDSYGAIVGFAWRRLNPGPDEKKYNNTSEAKGFDKGNHLYGLHIARRLMKDRIFVAEGYPDVWSGYQARFPVVGICTSKMTEAQASLLAKTVADGEAIVWVPDTDTIGQNKCADNIMLMASKAPKSPQYVAVVPDKDLGDLAHNPEEVRAVLERSITATEWLVRKALKDNPDLDAQMRAVDHVAKGITNPIERDELATLLAEAWRKDLGIVREFLGTAHERARIDPGKLLAVGSSVLDFLSKGDGFHVGIPEIDDNTRGVSGGEVMGIMARSSVGKTTFALNVAHNLVKRYPDMPGVFFSMEQQAGPVELRLCQIHYGKNRDSAVDYLLFGGQEEFAEAYRSLLICQEGGLTVEDMDQYLSLASSRRFGSPVGWIAIDYLGYIAPPKGMTNPYQIASHNAKAVKQLAKKHNVAVFLLLQTGRKGEGSGADEVHLSDARDSGVVEESVDFLMGLWRPSLANPKNIPEQDTLWCRLLKNRNGPPGEVALTFNTETLQVYEGVLREARTFSRL